MSDERSAAPPGSMEAVAPAVLPLAPTWNAVAPSSWHSDGLQQIVRSLAASLGTGADVPFAIVLPDRGRLAIGIGTPAFTVVFNTEAALVATVARRIGNSALGGSIVEQVEREGHRPRVRGDERDNRMRLSCREMRPPLC